MKNIAVIITSVIITSLIWLVLLQDDRYNRLRSLEKDVWLPMRSIIGDINDTALENDEELLRLKLKLLSKKWDAYVFNGEIPFEFKDEIINADKKRSQKSNER